MEGESFPMESLAIMKIESPKTILLKPAEAVFNMLIDVRHFRKLMPDNVAKFEVLSDDKFLFALQGMPEISLKLKAKYPSQKIVYEAADGKIPFTLTLVIEELVDSKSEIQFIFEGEFNTMMRMMIKTPISNFISVLSKNSIKL